MTIILDTDQLSLIEGDQSGAATRLRSKLAKIPPEQVATTIITYEEQTRGWLAYAARARTVAEQVLAYEKLLRHLDTYRAIRVLPFDESAAVEFQRLRQGGVRIGTFDLRIAAIALARAATLGSRNLRDFKKVPGLDVQDWSSSNAG